MNGVSVALVGLVEVRYMIYSNMMMMILLFVQILLVVCSVSNEVVVVTA